MNYPVLVLVFLLTICTLFVPSMAAPAVSPGAGPDTGALDVRTTPNGANVYIDTEMRGVTPVTITGLSPGTHVLLLTLNGYQDYITVVTIEPGKTREYKTTLRENLGRTDEIGIGIPGLEQIPGFEAGIAFAGLVILLAIRNKPV